MTTEFNGTFMTGDIVTYYPYGDREFEVREHCANSDFPFMITDPEGYNRTFTVVTR